MLSDVEVTSVDMETLCFQSGSIRAPTPDEEESSSDEVTMETHFQLRLFCILCTQPRNQRIEIASSLSHPCFAAKIKRCLPS